MLFKAIINSYEELFEYYKELFNSSSLNDDNCSVIVVAEEPTEYQYFQLLKFGIEGEDFADRSSTTTQLEHASNYQNPNTLIYGIPLAGSLE